MQCLDIPGNHFAATGKDSHYIFGNDITQRGQVDKARPVTNNGFMVTSLYTIACLAGKLKKAFQKAAARSGYSLLGLTIQKNRTGLYIALDNESF